MRYFCGMLLLGFLVGCCHADVNILERGRNKLTALSYSSERQCATDKAKEEAKKRCDAKGKRLVVTNIKTNYQGADKNLKGVAAGIGTATGNYINMDTKDDYEVKLQFHCR